MKTNLSVLIQAAEYLERKEREMEHGYATTLPMPEDYNTSGSYKSTNSSIYNSNKSPKRVRSKSKLNNSRTTHNELEKNRRAHLRTCLEKLKEMVPLGPDGSRHTTLGLLTRAKYFIKNLEDKDRKQSTQKDNLEREHRYLQRRLELLESQFEDFASKRRSVSESSIFSTESCGSSTSVSSNSETDEVDILGYGSNQSDTDDHSSVQSFGSDRCVVLSTRRLTITDPSPLLNDQHKL